MNNAELISRYEERSRSRQGDESLAGKVEGLADAYFFYGSFPVTFGEITLRDLRKDWKLLRGEIEKISLEETAQDAFRAREFIFNSFAAGMHIRETRLPEFEFVQQIRSAVPRILGSEPEQWLGLETYAQGLRFTTGAAVLLAGYADLEKPELFTPERRRHIGEFVVRQNSFLDRNDSKIRVDGVASALALTFDWQPAPISRT